MTAVFLFFFCAPPSGEEWAQLEKRLDSPVYQERKQAELDLKKKGSLEAFRLLSRSTSPEVRLRTRSEYHRLREEFLASLGPLPRLDALWYNKETGYYAGHDDPFSKGMEDRYAAPARERRSLEQLVKFGGGWWGTVSYGPTDYVNATYVWLEDMIDHGMPVWYLKNLVEEMRELDKDAAGNHAKPEEWDG